MTVKVVPAQGWCVVATIESMGLRPMVACWPVIAWAVDEDNATAPALPVTAWGPGITGSAHHHSGACSPVWQFGEGIDCFDALHKLQVIEREGRAGR